MKQGPSEELGNGGYFALRDRAVFRLAGPDRVRYLNGQVSNDVSGDLEAEAVAACVCSAKGKVEALVWVHSREDALWVDGPLSCRDGLLERLDRYLIADDCEWEDLTESGTLFHHFDETMGGARSKRTTRWGRDLWLPTDENPPFDEALAFAPEILQREMILAGIPGAPAEITGNEFPAELGIAEWAVDFRKGCYLGQEVVSRIQSVGRVKRHLVRVVAETSFGQDAVLRNDSGEEGRATRASLEAGEKKHLGFAWFRDGVDRSELVGVEKVSSD